MSVAGEVEVELEGEKEEEEQEEQEEVVEVQGSGGEVVCSGVHLSLVSPCLPLHGRRRESGSERTMRASAISIIDVSAYDEPACRPRPGRHRVWKRGEAREAAVWGGGWVAARASSGPRARHHYTLLVHTENKEGGRALSRPPDDTLLSPFYIAHVPTQACSRVGELGNRETEELPRDNHDRRRRRGAALTPEPDEPITPDVVPRQIKARRGWSTDPPESSVKCGKVFGFVQSGGVGSGQW
ncbi:hypothetical protein E2C01_039382 [Portunus trituberculatus]|uniref:Uncharacterized protein n=1 Tax=Portunus trituberculatus TaxID=210409 RepID=A0A5B7FMW6_PORTR|nr:hypothetical protein [Portunus trituberculatus]